MLLLSLHLFSFSSSFFLLFYHLCSAFLSFNWPRLQSHFLCPLFITQPSRLLSLLYSLFHPFLNPLWCISSSGRFLHYCELQPPRPGDPGLGKCCSLTHKAGIHFSCRLPFVPGSDKHSSINKVEDNTLSGGKSAHPADPHSVCWLWGHTEVTPPLLCLWLQEADTVRDQPMSNESFVLSLSVTLKRNWTQCTVPLPRVIPCSHSNTFSVPNGQTWQLDQWHLESK